METVSRQWNRSIDFFIFLKLTYSHMTFTLLPANTYATSNTTVPNHAVDPQMVVIHLVQVTWYVGHWAPMGNTRRKGVYWLVSLNTMGMCTLLSCNGPVRSMPLYLVHNRALICSEQYDMSEGNCQVGNFFQCTHCRCLRKTTVNFLSLNNCDLVQRQQRKTQQNTIKINQPECFS